MNIAFFGSSLVSAYWNGAATYYRGILSALYERGHRSVFYEPDAWDRQKHRDIADPPYARSVVYPATDSDDVLHIVETAARDADLLVKASGVGVMDALLDEAVLQFCAPSRRVVFWDVDAAATLERVCGNPEDPFRSLIPRYDVILTYGGGAPVVGAYRELGARNCVPIYNALDPSTHYPVAPDERFNAALSFLGNRLPDREERVGDFFFKTARLNPDLRFMLGGSGWGETTADYANVSYVGHVSTNDHNAFNATPLAVLNVCRDSMARYGFSPPTRVFEAAGAGACVVTDAWEGIEFFLEPDSECLVARSGEEVSEHLRRLTHRRSREIGERARKRINAQHTYAHRAAELEAALRELP